MSEPQKYIRIEGKNFVTIAAYAELRGVTRQTVYNWIRKGKVTVYRMLNRQLILID